ALAAGDKDNCSSRCAFDRICHQEVGARMLLVFFDGVDFEIEIFSLRRSNEILKNNVQFTLEVIANIVENVLLRGGRETADGGNGSWRVFFLDEARYIQI